LFHACRRCGLRFQEAAPDEDGSIYADVEVAREEECGAAGPCLVLDADTLRCLRDLAPGPRLLDVGSGDGRFLRSARDAGFEPEGVDISPALAEVARDRSDCRVHVGALADLALPAESFDAVNLDLVLMYVPDTGAMLREVARLLRPGGVCRIREYFADSLNARAQRERWWFYCESTLRAFTRRSLHLAAADAGMETARWYPGTEVSLETWRRYAARKSARGAAVQQLQYWAKRAAVLGVPVAGDCTCYLRKPAGTQQRHATGAVPARGEG
jgi:SAM-dependent methyltransferase